MNINRSLLCAALAVVSLGSAHTARAQQANRRFVVTPYAGIFVPGTRIAQFRSGLGGSDHVVGIRQQSALALGANASYWFSNLTGIEVGGAWAFSDARPTGTLSSEVPGALSGTQSAYVLFASAKMMLNILPFSETRALRFGFGPALITHGGNAYKADGSGKFTDLTDFGGAVSLCSRIPLTNFISMRLRAEDFIYSSRFRFQTPTSGGQDVEFAGRLQNDFVFSAGLQMVFWR
jgi:hypothetical protein